MIDLKNYGGSKPFTWTHEYLVKLVGTGSQPIITDPILLNAFRTINRADFVHSKFKEVANQDKTIDLGFGEIMTNPTTVAKQLQIFSPRVGGRYLHLGAGTGYVSAILAFVAGSQGQVFALERIQWLWEQARSAVLNYPQIGKTLEILYRDGSEGLPLKAPYDGILYSFAIADIPVAVTNQLAVGGKLVAPMSDDTLRVIVRSSEDEFIEEVIHGFSLYSYGEKKEGTI